MRTNKNIGQKIASDATAFRTNSFERLIGISEMFWKERKQASHPLTDIPFFQ